MTQKSSLTKNELTALFIGFVLVSLLVVFSWAATNADLSIILLGFSPFILYVLINSFHVEYTHHRHVVLFISPVAFVGLFFLLSAFGVFPTTMDIYSLSFLNIFFCYLAGILFHITTKQETITQKEEPKQPSHKHDHTVHHHVYQGELEKPLQRDEN